jgi:hypothetical protein
MARCKNCNEKFTQKYMLQKFCMVHDECIKRFAEQTKMKVWKEKKAKIKNELMTLQDWIKITQVTFNNFIRLRDKGKPCIACNSSNMKKVNASHYYSAGGHYNVRFDENNVFSGCEHCNTFLSGNLIPFRENLIKRIGFEEFERLTINSQITRKFTIEELKQINQTYKEKIKELNERRDN